jgi:hypothetical protein
MKVVINKLGNGACPICTRMVSCSLYRALSDSVVKFKDPDAHGLEVVVYSCPLFTER